MKVDRATQVLLTLICLALWVIALKSFIQTTTVYAQTQRKQGVYIADGKKMKIYPYEKLSSKFISEGGRLSMSVSEMEVGAVLQDASSRGWRIVAVTESRSGSYTIFVEK